MASRRASPDIKGCELPRIYTKPLRRLTPRTSRGFEVITFAEDILRIELMPWQKWWLIHALELLPDGSYRFRTLLLLVARQNGKTTLIQVLALWRIYLDGAGLVLGTAQNLDVAEECWQGAVDMARGCPELDEEIAAVVHVNGKKSLQLISGERYKVQAANRRGGRGLSGNLVILDELREHQSWDAWGAITKTTMAKDDAQVIGASNAGDSASIVLSHMRTIAIAERDDEDTSVFIAEWSAKEGCALDDWDEIAQANPALGWTISVRAIVDAMNDPEGIYRTEVLCQFVENITGGPIPYATWQERLDKQSTIPEAARLAFAVDMGWQRETSFIGVSGLRTDGKAHVEVVAAHYGTDWIIPWFKTRVDVYKPVAIGYQGTGAPISEHGDLLKQEFGDIAFPIGGADLARASGSLDTAVRSGKLAHIGQVQLDEGLRHAVARTMNDAWLWDRRHSGTDIAPLVAVTEAHYLMLTAPDPEPEAEMFTPIRLRR